MSSHADKLRWAAGTLDILAQKIAEAGDEDDNLIRAHMLTCSAFDLLGQMRVATDESSASAVRATAFREMDKRRERIERVFRWPAAKPSMPAKALKPVKPTKHKPILLPAAPLHSPVPDLSDYTFEFRIEPIKKRVHLGVLTTRGPKGQTLETGVSYTKPKGLDWLTHAFKGLATLQDDDVITELFTRGGNIRVVGDGEDYEADALDVIEGIVNERWGK